MRLLFAAFFLLLPFSPQACFADVTYSSFGPNDNFSTLSGTGFGNLSAINSEQTNYHLANGFTAEVTGKLSSIELPLSIPTVLPNAEPAVAEIELWSHQVTSPNLPGTPGSLLWSGVTDLVTNEDLNFAIYEVEAIADGPLLVAGEIYWVVASSFNGEFPFLWAPNEDPFRTSPFGFSKTDVIVWEGESLTTEQAYRVNVSSIPEPIAFHLVWIVFATSARYRRKAN